MDISLAVSIPLAALTAAIIITHYYYRNKFKFWQKQGLKGPRAYPIFGNLIEMALDREAGSRWARAFGKVYGIYDGRQPTLVVSEPDVMRQLCITDFDVFPNHPDTFLNSELTSKFVISLKDDHWRRVRAIMSPTFTSGKMRRMYRLIDVCAENLLENLREQLKCKQIVNLKDLFGLYTMDAIASCCYGMRLMSYKSESSLKEASNRDDFVKLAMRLFELKIWRFLIFACVPESVLKRFDFGMIPVEYEWAFARRVEQIIKNRRESNKSFDDYLQTLIDSKCEVAADEDQLDNERHHATGGHHENRTNGETFETHQAGGYKAKPLTETEVLSNAMLLLIVGLETTSTLLTHCIYTLSFHRDIQEELHQSIKALATYENHLNPSRASFEYDSLTSCHYLDAVVSETLRKHPPFPSTDRYASRDYYLESHKLHLPKGTKVVFAMKPIMEDPDYWHEPQVFNPERFMPEQQHKIKPYSYCPFGIGPRHCLGMRFSLTETKLALAKLLLEFRFEPAPGTKYPGERRLVAGLFNIQRPEVTVIRR